jgi:hypothetical protein
MNIGRVEISFHTESGSIADAFELADQAGLVFFLLSRLSDWSLDSIAAVGETLELVAEHLRSELRTISRYGEGTKALEDCVASTSRQVARTNTMNSLLAGTWIGTTLTVASMGDAALYKRSSDAWRDIVSSGRQSMSAGSETIDVVKEAFGVGFSRRRMRLAECEVGPGDLFVGHANCTFHAEGMPQDLGSSVDDAICRLRSATECRNGALSVLRIN